MSSNSHLLYICHYCCDYYTNNKTDLRRHYERMRKCNCNNLLTSYENSCFLSLNKRFIFDKDFNFKNFKRDDILFIITNYTDDVNYIRKDYKKIKNTNLNTNLNTNTYKKEDLSSILESIISSSTSGSYNSLNTESENSINSETENNSINTLFDEASQKYICNLCKSSYKYKQGIEKHLLDNERCIKLQKIEHAIKTNKDTIRMIKEKERLNQQINNTFIHNDNSVNNINNFQNNSSNQNMYHFQLKDFIHENYDLSHIKEDYYLQKDFFLYPNLLKMIMENERNHNIFFSENEAIIYSDNELNKMSSEKAGYLILDKLNQSFNQLYYRQDEETQKFYAYVQKYYFVIKGHYKHDTIHKDYDVNEKRFIYTANSSMFRSRDKYLNKIISSLANCKESARQKMLINLDEIKNIPVMNPNIEDFASIKMRYRDLRDRDRD